MAIKQFAANKFVGLSGDTKPLDVPDGSNFYESDTYKNFLKVGGVWSQLYRNIRKRLCFVNAASGNNSTALVERQDFPFKTIQAAIDACVIAGVNVNSWFSIRVEPGTYTEDISMADFVTVKGEDPAVSKIVGTVTFPNSVTTKSTIDGISIYSQNAEAIVGDMFDDMVVCDITGCVLSSEYTVDRDVKSILTSKCGSLIGNNCTYHLHIDDGIGNDSTTVSTSYYVTGSKSSSIESYSSKHHIASYAGDEILTTYYSDSSNPASRAILKDCSMYMELLTENATGRVHLMYHNQSQSDSRSDNCNFSITLPVSNTVLIVGTFSTNSGGAGSYISLSNTVTTIIHPTQWYQYATAATHVNDIIKIATSGFILKDVTYFASLVYIAMGALGRTAFAFTYSGEGDTYSTGGLAGYGLFNEITPTSATPININRNMFALILDTSLHSINVNLQPYINMDHGQILHIKKLYADNDIIIGHNGNFIDGVYADLVISDPGIYTFQFDAFHANWNSMTMIGSSGYSGASGYSGLGLSGYSGYSGIDGASSYSGISGYSSYSGISGYEGISGYSGNVGTSGYSGNVGTSGHSGIIGTSGYSGVSGYSGLDGQYASSGYSGISGYSGRIGLGDMFGSWESKSNNTNYQADVDGFVVAYRTSVGSVVGYTDGNSTPSTQVAVAAHTGALTTFDGTVTFPVRKDDYWRVEGANTVRWISGTGGNSGYSGLSGYSGVSGYGGISGYSGTSGISGYYGDSGYSGIRGFSGYSSYSGIDGLSGYSGYSGFSGISGFSGEVGEQGTSGYSGIEGTSGYSGISGYSGFSGIWGYSGMSGYSGRSGASGLSGYDGDVGASGYSGLSGYSGISGISGYSSYSGISGYSSYSGMSGFIGISGISGYTGTSGYSGLQAASGYSGISGFVGVSGYSGQSGYSGVSGYSGRSGYSGISGYNGYSGISGISGFVGISGISGYSGVSGFVGPSGYSGYSGVSGFVGTSGISGYSGLSGISGFVGISGISGYSGLSGESGYSGISGFVGISGYSGRSGYSGLSGISGYSGTSGFTHTSGYSGYSGISGISGYSGYSGISGYSGYSGISGISGISGYSSYSGVSGYSGYTASRRTVQVFDNNGGQDLNVSTPAAIPWNSQDHIDTDTFSHSTTVNNTRVTVLVTGRYRINYMVNLTTSSGERTTRCRLRVDGTTYKTRGTSYAYCRNTANDKGTCCGNWILDLTANQYIEIMGDLQGAIGPWTTAAGEVSLSLELLNP